MSEYLNVYRAPSETLSYFRCDGFEALVAATHVAGEVPFEQCTDFHRVFVTLAGQTRSTVAEIDGLPVVRRPDRPGATTIVPAGVRRTVLLQDIDFTIIDLRISEDFLAGCRDEDRGRTDGASDGLPILQNVRNDWMLRAAQAFADAAARGAAPIQLETLAYMIVRHLAGHPDKVRESGGLDARALSRVLHMMHDRLAENVTLRELADEAGLGVSAFSRAFAKSLGVPPFRYFLAVRMQRAKELLTRSDLPLAEIADETGYADQAHFTAAFTREAGVPPGRWRSESGSIPGILPISRKTDRPSAP